MLKLKNVTKEYGLKFNITKAVDNVSLHLNKGEIISIVGNSGSGKSTLLNLMSTMDSPTTGEVYYQGNRIDNLSQHKKATLRLNDFGFIFQKYYLMSTLNVYDNICMPLILAKRHIDNTSIYNLLERLNIYQLASKMPSQLSGGEQQRVAIARAIVQNPEIIFADEPTGNLDSKNGEIVIQLLLQIAKQDNKSVVFVTHNMEMAQKADKIICIKDGVVNG